MSARKQRRAHIHIQIFEEDPNAHPNNTIFGSYRIVTDYGAELDEQTAVEILYSVLPVMPGQSAIQPHVVSQPSWMPIKNAYVNGQLSKIEAIKQLREWSMNSPERAHLPTMGLVEAKGLVDAWADEIDSK